MSYSPLVFIDFQSIVHKLQKIGRKHKVVFQNDDAVVAFERLRHAVDNRASQAPIFVAFNDVNCPKTLDGPHETPHLENLAFRRFVFGGIRKNKQLAFNRQIVGKQRRHTPPHVLGTVIDEKEDGGSVHTLENNCE